MKLRLKSCGQEEAAWCQASTMAATGSSPSLRPSTRVISKSEFETMGGGGKPYYISIEEVVTLDQEAS
jgi:hypothetical protein